MKIQIKWLSENELKDVCLVSRNIFDSLKLSENAKLKLYFGHLSRSIFIKPFDDTENYLYLPPDIFSPAFTKNELLFFEDRVLNIWKKGKDIHLGPVLGVFINPKRLIPEMGSTIQSHIIAGLSKYFLCYSFSLKNIDWNNKKIKGLTYISGVDKWTFAWFPMPEVIYDLGTKFSEEQKTMAREIRKRFRSNLNVHFINNLDHISKWKSYRQLSKYDKIAGYLPATVRYGSFKDFMRMLKKHRFVFLKAYYGSRGKQVMSIEKINGQYKLVFFADELQVLILSSLEELRTHIEQFIDGRKFIIQQGIRLLKFKGSCFDMRVLIIKDNEGKWKIVSNYARIAKANLNITNYSAGGDCNFYNNIYSDLSCPLCRGSIPNYDEIASETLKIAAVIEQEFGTFGELGMDMAIDEYGKLWFFEANTKPDKDLVEGLDDFDEINPQYLAIFEYAEYLCGL